MVREPFRGLAPAESSRGSAGPAEGSAWSSEESMDSLMRRSADPPPGRRGRSPLPPSVIRVAADQHRESEETD